ncbi:response regulator [Flavisolibacter nicotianae]|uniref:response regulator n=1 Tax=Flavisolibacter nicotianae TaxID=2364882 RepID=UPI000EB3EA09|nr:response regulator [Flavisolibacter nicotianae]
MHVDHNILCIDDDAEDLDILKSALEDAGKVYRIESAHNGEEAITKLKEMQLKNELPRLIILDVNMPKMDGKQTLKAIKSHQRFKAIPVIVFSTASKEGVIDIYSEYGAEYIPKPVQ